MRMAHTITLAFLAMLMASACSGNAGTSEREIGGLTAITYNYSDEYVSFVRVSGRLAGSGLESVKPGGVTGGGRSCCVSLNAYATSLPVEIKPAGADAYIVEGQVEQPWPKGASTVIVHVLPGRKVVIETTLGVGISPRLDLLENRLSELGIRKEVEYPPSYFNVRRNTYKEYMEVPE